MGNVIRNESFGLWGDIFVHISYFISASSGSTKTLTSIKRYLTKYWPLTDGVSKLTSLRICDKQQNSKHMWTPTITVNWITRAEGNVQVASKYWKKTKNLTLLVINKLHATPIRKPSFFEEGMGDETLLKLLVEFLGIYHWPLWFCHTLIKSNCSTLASSCVAMFLPLLVKIFSAFKFELC